MSNEENQIRQLIEAAKSEERAKIAVKEVLDEIDRRLCALEQAHRDTDQVLNWIKGVVQGVYTNVSTLIQLMAAVWQNDRTSLVTIQERIAEQAFAFRDGDVSGGEIEIQAQGNVNLSADKVGRDKKGSKKDER